MQGLRLASVPVLLSLFGSSALAQDQGPLPKGPGVNLVYAKCQQCHPINYVVDSAGLPDFLWEDTLSLMKQLGMQVTEDEEQTLYRYLTTYLGTDPPPEPAAEGPDAPHGSGAAIYAESCAVCHGSEGQGTPGAFPPLAGHVTRLATADRSYLPLVVLYGVSGAVEISGTQYNGVMPAWGQLSDEEIAALLNTVTGGWGPEDDAGTGKVAPYTAEEIGAARGLGLSPGAVRERRPEIPAM